MLQTQWSPIEFNVLNICIYLYIIWDVLNIDCPRSLERDVEFSFRITLRQLFTLMYFLLLGGQVSLLASGLQFVFSSTRSRQGLLEKPLCLRDILYLKSSFCGD